MTARPREAMQRRFDQFRFECPQAGDDFPLQRAPLLDAGTWQSSDYLGRILVLEFGSFT